MRPRSFPRIIEYVATTPWAINEAGLQLIVDIIGHRATEHTLTVEARADAEHRITAALEAARGRKAGAPTPPGSIAVIPIDGPIVPKADSFSAISGATSMETLAEEIRAAAADPNVAAIVLNIDSPGGSVDLVPETAAVIAKAANQKTVVAVANTMADSAAYWLASQATEIVASPSAEVGSIGVIAAHTDVSALQDKAGIRTTLITYGKNKGELSSYQPLSDDARRAVQDRVDQTGEMFVADVARGRRVPVQQVKDTYGQGRSLSARDALARGMIDRIETLDETLARLAGGDTQRTRRADAHTTADLLAAADLEFTSALEVTSTAGAELELTVNLAGDATEPDMQDHSRATAASTAARKESTVTIDQLVARQDEIEARQKELDAEHTGKLMEGDPKEEFDKLETEYASNKAIIEDHTRRKALIDRKAGPQATVDGFAGRDDDEPKTVHVIGSSTRAVPDNIYDLERYRGRANSIEKLAELYRDGAKRALEGADFPHPRADREHVQTHIARLLANDSRDGTIARRLLATGSPLYDRAFAKAISGRPLSSAEQHALSMAALSLDNSDGGYAVPFTLDPTVIPTSNGAVNPYRAIAAVKTLASGNTWKGVSSDGVSVTYEAEGAEVAETSPVLAQPSITVEKAQVFVQFSIEIENDWPQMRGELAIMIQDAKDQTEAEKFTVGAGHGSDEPEGIIAGLGGGSLVPTAGSSLDQTDIDVVDGELPPRFEPNAVWVANKAFYGALRQLTGDQFDVFMPLADGIDKRRDGNTGRLLAGYPSYRCSEMTSDMTTESEKIAVLGDFRYFAIVDKVGMTLELVPHLFGAGRRPTGERGLYGWYRNSSGILSDNAFRILQIQPD